MVVDNVCQFWMLLIAVFPFLFVATIREVILVVTI